MENLPAHISIIFGLTTVLTVGIFYIATNYSTITLTIILTWLLLQTFIGISGFYTMTDTIPPRFLLLILPPFLLIIALFSTSKGKQFIDTLDAKTLTILHTIRIPVEIVLLWLFIHNTIPELMTFEGRNFDILSGLTAPVIFYFGFIKKKLDSKIILIWNFICLGLLFNIVGNAILSVPSPFQKLAFDQPNIAVLHFPFIWLPTCVVPLVLFSHLAMIRRILNAKRKIIKTSA
ncbi:MAG TPA: hypothetical protein VD884_04805 [Ohtaekwangia sp.]|nr:hypothetical protein [Ohtaekwangia sp.]